MEKKSLLDEGQLDKDQILKDFGALLNSLKASVESSATADTLTVTLRFAGADKSHMRKLAALVGDHVC